ncbi:MAG: restriction endonuclease subunit S [Calditrichaeota bacterium]|nr:restriction endonuclease subunit S [Calditrichota bacterium]
MKKADLGKYISIIKGKKANTVYYSPQKGTKRYLQIEDLRDNSQIKYTTDKGIEATANDVIIAWDGANAGTVGFGIEGFIGSTLALLRIKNVDLLNAAYVGRYLQSKFDFIRSNCSGATIPHVRRDILEELQIPLPPINEQKRIATILDKADAIRQKRRESLRLADEFLRATFLDMFGDPVTNPKGWEKVFLRDAILDIISGWSIKGESRKKRRGELGILKVSAVTSGYFKPQEHKTISEPPTGRNLIHPEKDDLLFSRANTRELVAATCIVNQNYPDLLLPDKLWKLIFNEDLIDPYFFHAALSNNRLRSELTKTATGTSGSMLNVSMEKLRNLLIPAPPITIQRKFREIYSRIESTKNQSNHSLSYAENLFNSLTQRAFKGEL